MITSAQSQQRDTDLDPTQPLEPDESLGELFARMTSDVSELFATQIELAKVEIKEQATKASKGAGLLGGGAVAALYALLLASFALAWGIAEVLSPWIGFLVVAVLYAVVAAVLYAKGRAQIRSVTPVAQQTIASLKEDAEWARQQKS